MNRIFGVNAYNLLDKNKLNSGCTSAKYVWLENEKQYETLYECGGLSLESLNSKFVSAEKVTKGGSIKIELILAIYFTNKQENAIFSDVNFKNMIGNNIDINKLPQYKHTFELDSNDNYIYKTVERIRF